MKPTYRLFRRGKYFYSEDTRTGRQESLKTADWSEAQRLLVAKNEATNSNEFRLAVGRAYLAAVDPEILERTWTQVMALMEKRGKESTQDRCHRALRSKAFDPLRDKVIIETTAGDFLNVLEEGKHTTNHHLKMIQALALDLGWLVKPVLCRKAWPKVALKEKRAITWDEHCRLTACERNPERKLYYELLWETGASQSDAAQLSSENVDWTKRTLVYHRLKTRQQASLGIGPTLERILRQLPAEGPFFPTLIKWDCVRRSIEFIRRCRIAKIEGVSLHSYRYAWAQRAFQAGYPERYAQAALGHESRAIHHAYAKRAKVNCPALEVYEAGG